MDINFNQLMAEAGEGFQPVPPGPYTVECEKADAGQSSTQKPQIKVTLRILGGDHNGRKLFDQFTLTAGNPVALGFFFDNMAAFGLDRAFFSTLQMDNPMPYVAQMLLGRQANVAVGIEPYQGVDRNKIKQYRPIAGGQAPAQVLQPGVPAAVPGYPAAPGGAMPVAQPQPQPQPQQQQYAPQSPPQQYPSQYAPQQPQPAVAGWQPQAAAMPPQPAPPQEQQPQFMPQQQPQQPQQPQPIPPGAQQAQPQQAPMWQPSTPPPGYVDPNQQQQAPQGPPPMPQGVPPMPGVPAQGI